MKRAPAEILREYGPFPGIDAVGGVSFDGQRVWCASGDRLNALNPESGEIVATITVAADAGTAFDGTHLYQIVESGELQDRSRDRRDTRRDTSAHVKHFAGRPRPTICAPST